MHILADPDPRSTHHAQDSELTEQDEKDMVRLILERGDAPKPSPVTSEVAANTAALQARLADRLPSWLELSPDTIGTAYYRYKRKNTDRVALAAMANLIESLKKSTLPKSQCGRYASRSLVLTLSLIHI